MKKQVIVWFQEDLRLDDNPALFHALRDSERILPLYIYDTARAESFAYGGAAKWFLHHALDALSSRLKNKGAHLHICRGDPLEVLPRLCKACGIDAVYQNELYQPYTRQRDQELSKILSQQDVGFESFAGRLLHDPDKIKTKGGDPYRVFTPFWRACTETNIDPHIFPCPETINALSIRGGETLESLKLLPTAPNWASGFEGEWDVSEKGARGRLQAFLETGVTGYKDKRNFPALPHTSKLSPYLQWGLISPGQIWQAVQDWALAHGKTGDKDVVHFLSEVGWREFSYHLLYHFPDLPHKNLNSRFDEFPWGEPDPKVLNAWQRGQTGYPLIDAGMRELWATGWMHNRVRMVVASFLVKHLLIHWHHGEKWFWDTLVDADLASNSASWQWVAGCGADAAPYFRVFNPILQSKKFDPKGEYIRKWVPEIADLPDEYIHEPWTVPSDIFNPSKFKVGRDYPLPIVDHDKGRIRALEAYDKVKG